MAQHRYKDAIVWDVGCGRELPMAKLLYSSKMFPSLYVGIDYGPVDTVSFGKYDNKVKVYEKEDFATCRLLNGQPAPDVVICFEVLEHVEPKHMLNILRRIKRVARPSADIFISTPCWNVTDCAGNHVNEMKFNVLGAIFVRLGFKVKDVYGTFASRRDYDHMLGPAYKEMFDRLCLYYDSNLVSCIFAPLFPGQSRNALWHLRLIGEGRCFPLLENIDKPWSSSEKWPPIEEIDDAPNRETQEPAPVTFDDE
jgi:hypothetical protein